MAKQIIKSRKLKARQWCDKVHHLYNVSGPWRPQSTSMLGIFEIPATTKFSYNNIYRKAPTKNQIIMCNELGAPFFSLPCLSDLGLTPIQIQILTVFCLSPFSYALSDTTTTVTSYFSIPCILIALFVTLGFFFLLRTPSISPHLYSASTLPERIAADYDHPIHADDPEVADRGRKSEKRIRRNMRFALNVKYRQEWELVTPTPRVISAPVALPGNIHNTNNTASPVDALTPVILQGNTDVEAATVEVVAQDVQFDAEGFPRVPGDVPADLPTAEELLNAPTCAEPTQKYMRNIGTEHIASGDNTSKQHLQGVTTVEDVREAYFNSDYSILFESGFSPYAYTIGQTVRASLAYPERPTEVNWSCASRMCTEIMDKNKSLRTCTRLQLHPQALRWVFVPSIHELQNHRIFASKNIMAKRAEIISPVTNCSGLAHLCSWLYSLFRTVRTDISPLK
jgi:hypothetical protein